MVDPRWRGVCADGDGETFVYTGRSPLARSVLGQEVRRHRTRGPIPAGAGLLNAWATDFVRGGLYPRIRGACYLLYGHWVRERAYPRIRAVCPDSLHRCCASGVYPRTRGACMWVLSRGPGAHGLSPHPRGLLNPKPGTRA